MDHVRERQRQRDWETEQKRREGGRREGGKERKEKAANCLFDASRARVEVQLTSKESGRAPHPPPFEDFVLLRAPV